MPNNSIRTSMATLVAATMLLSEGRPVARAAAPPRSDLPSGAVARLGTLRFRQGGFVTCLDLSRDGKRLLTLGGGHARVWDSTTGKELFSHDISRIGDIEQGALAPDGKIAAVCGEHGLAMIDVASGNVVSKLPVRIANCVAFAPDGNTLATAGMSGSMLWDAATLTPITKLETMDPHPDGLPRAALSYSADGSLLAWIHGRKVGLRKLRVGNAAHRFLDIKNHVRAVALSPDGKLLATSTDDKAVQFRDVASGKLVHQLVGHAVIVRRIVFSPDGALLATSSNEPGSWLPHELHALRLWNAATGREVAKLGRHTWGLVAGRFSPDGSRLYSGGNMSVRVWDVMVRKEIVQGVGHQSYVSGIMFSPDDRRIATVGGDTVVQLWDSATGKVTRKLDGCEEAVDSIAYSPDGSRLAAGCRNGRFVVWDASNGTMIARLPAGQPYHEAVVAFSPDGKLLASGCRDGQVVLWDPVTVKEVRRFPPSRQGVTSLAFTPDSTQLALAGLGIPGLVGGPEAEMVRLYDIATCKEVRRYAGFAQSASSVYSVCFSPDGRLMAANANTIEVWDAATSRKVHQLRPGPLGSKLAFSPDGRTLASADDEGRVRLWEVSTGAERRSWRGHIGWVHAVAFSPDGRTLATGGRDTTVLLWDVRAPRVPARATPDEPWQALANLDGGKAYDAILALAASPGAAVPLLRRWLLPAEEKGALIRRLLAELDSDDYATREKATEALARLGAIAEPALRQALEGKPSPEVRRRVERLLQKLRSSALTGEELRHVRAVEALEYCDTAEARKLLDALSRGSGEARLTREAKAALARLARRTAR
jgi:WD40 repeat protein